MAVSSQSTGASGLAVITFKSRNRPTLGQHFYNRVRRAYSIPLHGSARLQMLIHLR